VLPQVVPAGTSTFNWSGVPPLNRIAATALPHPDRTSHPAFIGFDLGGRVIVEIMYGPVGTDEWLAQYVISSDGAVIDSRDEDYGRTADFEPFALAEVPNSPPIRLEVAHNLVFAGGRWRGLRETDRLADVLHGLSISEKMAIGSLFTTHGITGSILGMVESRILATAWITERWVLLCRQIRVAVSVPFSRDVNGVPFDYDSYSLYFVQWLDNHQPLEEPGPPLDQLLAISQASFSTQPVDLLCDSNRKYLYLIDNSDDTPHATLHVFQL